MGKSNRCASELFEACLQEWFYGLTRNPFSLEAFEALQTSDKRAFVSKPAWSRANLMIVTDDGEAFAQP